MMHLTWLAANGDTPVIADPSQAAPEPMFHNLSSDGSGGTDNEIQTNAMQYLTAESTFWQLEPGENIVTFSAPSGSVEVTIEYASRYTGV